MYRPPLLIGALAQLILPGSLWITALSTPDKEKSQEEYQLGTLKFAASSLTISSFSLHKDLSHAGCQWLTSVILAIQEAEIRRIGVQSQPGQIVFETLSQKKKKNLSHEG
jgi:hypothetical protein